MLLGNNDDNNYDNNYDEPNDKNTNSLEKDKNVEYKILPINDSPDTCPYISVLDTLIA